MNNSYRNINQLPVEVLEIIFKKLNLQDKHLRCNLVCKFWRDIIKNLREDCLVVSNRVCVNEIWFHKNTSVSILNQVYPYNYDFLPDIQIKTTFLRLKKLFIYFGICEDELNFDRSGINQLKQLEHLELKHVNIKNECSLDLPNLKIFTFSTIASYQKLRLITPELQYLKCNFHNVEYEFDHLDNVTYLEADECKPIIERFKNLEYLISKKFTKIQINTLINLTKLKEVHDIGFSCLFGFQDLIFLRDLSQRKRELNRNVQVYICGLSFDTMKKNPFSIFGPNLTPFYSENFSDLVSLIHWEEKFHFDKFNFNDSLELVNKTTTKFPNIRHVFGEKVKNEELFLAFLKNCIHLDKLNLSLPFVNQESYGKLVANCPSITHLEVGVIGNKGQFIDLKFLLGFRYLCYFSISQEADLNIVRDVFNKLKYMKFFKFDYDNADERQFSFVTVQKRRDWKLEYKQTSEKFESLDRLIDFYELKKYEKESFYL